MFLKVTPQWIKFQSILELNFSAGLDAQWEKWTDPHTRPRLSSQALQTAADLGHSPVNWDVWAWAQRGMRPFHTSTQQSCKAPAPEPRGRCLTRSKKRRKAYPEGELVRQDCRKLDHQNNRINIFLKSTPGKQDRKVTSAVKQERASTCSCLAT